MSRNAKTPMYPEMGDLLRGWRSERHRSARAFYGHTRFSFSYSAYADFERGVTLPSPSVLHEIASALEKEIHPALWLWARVQMPTAELKKAFIGTPPSEIELSQSRSASSSKQDRPSFENTWVLGPTELPLFQKSPALWEVILSLVMAFPDSVDVGRFLEKGSSLKKPVQSWIRSGHIVFEEGKHRLRYQHIHVPRTAEWDDIRKNNLARAFEDLLSSISPDEIALEKAFRELIHRPLRPNQLAAWVRKLKELEMEFKTDPYLANPAQGDESPYALLILLGKRQSIVP